MFDHEIPLNQESRITIIHGPNGVGKTVLLRMVHGLFHYEYEYVGSVPFEQFRIEFESGEFITVKKEGKGAYDDEALKLLINYEDGEGTEHIPFRPLLARREILRKSIAELRPDLELVEVPFEKVKMYWVSIDKSEVFTKESILCEYPSLHTEVYGKMPDWLARIQAELRPTLISTTRLKLDSMEAEVYESLNSMKLYSEHRSILSSPDAVGELYSDPMLRIKDANREKYEKLLRELAAEKTELTEEIEEIQDALNESTVVAKHRVSSLLRERLEKLPSLQEELRLEELSLVDFIIEDVLDANLFLDIINERFLFKTASIDKGEGFKITASDNNEVPLSALSSGEQHLLVLYSQLLFEIAPATLVMIDEPELSMNVVWQRNFLKDLQRIIELRNFDVLIATHSPQIIHDKWDWMVALGETMDD